MCPPPPTYRSSAAPAGTINLWDSKNTTVNTVLFLNIITVKTNNSELCNKVNKSFQM